MCRYISIQGMVKMLFLALCVVYYMHDVHSQTGAGPTCPCNIHIYKLVSFSLSSKAQEFVPEWPVVG